MAKNCHDKHRQRLRKRFVQEGLDSFEVHNALELLLFNSIPRGDTNELAHILLDTFGSFSGVLDADHDNLLKVKGVGERTATLLELIPELCRLYMEDKAKPHKTYDTTEALCDLFIPKFIGRTQECVYAACFDNASKLIACQMLAKGTADTVLFPVKEIVQFVCNRNAANVAIAHNHPMGLCNPSSSDVTNSTDLKETLRKIQIRLVDHIIVGKNGDALSLVEYGVL